MKKILAILLIVFVIVAGWLYLVKGYIGIRKRHAVPASLIIKAYVPGMKNIRYVVDPMQLKRTKILRDIYESGLTRAKLPNKQVNVLAISGGGANGAYAAGVLCGWTKTGKRPQFDIVTGVSTGALIAPAAFLGPKYDRIVEDIYTNISDTDIARRALLQYFFEGRPSLLDTAPLRDILKSTVTKNIMDAVAVEHAKGRRLYIATANLDAKRLVIWDMGAIASYGTPEALELFRNVMLASSALPVIFPPVMIPVEAEGNLYDEMHADGTIAMQVFGSLLLIGYEDIRRHKSNVYVIRNGKAADVPSEVGYKIWDIAGAAFTMLVTWQSYGDIYRFAMMAKYERMKFFFTCIPYEFNEPRKGEFDLSYMRKLFYRGYREAATKRWLNPLDQNLRETAFTVSAG